MAVFFVFNTRFARVNVKGGQRNNLGSAEISGW